jgi:L-fuconate dehydratase
MKITHLEIVDLRFPTSLTNAGTDAVHKDPDYSAAYVILHTDGDLEGHGFTFTIGRGNEVCAEAIRAFTPLVVGRDVDEVFARPAAFWRTLAGDSQLRWLGPEKGVIHISMAAIVNAMWDLHAKRARKPLWKLLADMTPRQIVDCIDFQYITDALTEADAMAILEGQQETRAAREQLLLRDGYPAYTTSAGWIGYSDEKVRLLCR